MPRKWGFAYVGLTAMLLVAMSGPALAWEFGMAGSFNWTHEWYDQMGSSGFFGQYNIDRGATTNGDFPTLISGMAVSLTLTLSQGQTPVGHTSM